MQGRDANKRLNGRMGCYLHCLPGSLDIGRISTRDGTNLGIVNLRGNQTHCLKFSWRGNGEATIERVETHAGQCLSNCQLLFWKVVYTWSLFAISQRGFIKLDDSWFCCIRRHRTSLLPKLLCLDFAGNVLHSLRKLYASCWKKRKRLSLINIKEVYPRLHG